MSRRQKRVWSNGKRDGLTLIEVVAGVALAGTLLVAVISASSLHMRQLKQVDRKLAAADAIDGFLNQWSRYQFAQTYALRASKDSGCYFDDQGGVASEVKVKISLTVRPITVFENSRFEIVRVSAIAGPGHKNKGVDCWVEVLRPLQNGVRQ